MMPIDAGQEFAVNHLGSLQYISLICSITVHVSPWMARRSSSPP